MSLLFETIRVVDGVPLHLGYHAARMNRSRMDLFGSTKESGESGGGKRGAEIEPIDLGRAIVIPPAITRGIHRCRVLYGEQIDEITFSPYHPREVKSLTLVQADDLSYSHKYTDRGAIEKLREGIDGDDVLIVRRGLITDTSFSNIVFLDGSRWVTPASPLLYGTARARLLNEGRIIPREITPREIGRFNKAVLVNAMLEFGEERWIDVKNIR